MARLHTHKGTSGKIYAESVEPELSDSFKMCFDFQIRTQAVNFGATSVNIKVLISGLDPKVMSFRTRQ